jgi:hypothetical protein
MKKSNIPWIIAYLLICAGAILLNSCKKEPQPRVITFHNLTEYNVDVETMCGTSFNILPDSTVKYIDNVDGTPVCGCVVNYYKIIDGHDIILMHDQVITDDNYIYESIK